MENEPALAEKELFDLSGSLRLTWTWSNQDNWVEAQLGHDWDEHPEPQATRAKNHAGLLQTPAQGAPPRREDSLLRRASESLT